jgi:hypothetical protein
LLQSSLGTIQRPRSERRLAAVQTAATLEVLAWFYSPVRPMAEGHSSRSDTSVDETLTEPDLIENSVCPAQSYRAPTEAGIGYLNPSGPPASPVVVERTPECRLWTTSQPEHSESLAGDASRQPSGQQ